MKYDEMTPHQKIKLFNEEYLGKSRSICELAQEYGTYPNRMRRDAVRLGIKMRGKGEAQSAVLKSGRAKHPTKGKERDETTKIKISEKRAAAWSKISPEKKLAVSQKAKKQWADMEPEDKELFQKKASNAVRQAAKDGSKLERYIMESLVKEGYLVEFHKDHTLMNNRLQLDLFLPHLAIAIEVDGPSHFLPIWGEEVLKRNQSADIQKNGLLLNLGLIVIRVQQDGTVSQKYQRDKAAKLIALIKKIEAKKPDKNNRYFVL